MVIVRFIGDEIVGIIHFNGSYEDALIYAYKNIKKGHFDIVSESTFKWKYKSHSIETITKE